MRNLSGSICLIYLFVVLTFAAHENCKSDRYRPGIYVDLFEEAPFSGSGIRRNFHDAIIANQEPTSCLSRETCSCRSTSGQFLSKIHGKSVCLMWAMLRNCTLIEFKRRLYDNGEEKLSNPKECKDRKLHSCYVKPLSSCVKTSKTTEFQVDPMIDDNDALFSQLEQRWGIRGNLAIMSELVGYIFRPRLKVRKMVVQLAKMMRLGGCPGNTPLQQSGSLHIRHGDKVSSSVNDTMSFFELCKHAARVYGLSAIHVMSDDSEVPRITKQITETQNGTHNIRFTGVPSDMAFLGYDGSTTFETEVMNSYEQKTLQTDQLTMLLAEIILMAQGIILVGPQISNVDRAISELMGLVNWPVVMLDPYNDAYVAGALHETHNGVKWNQ